MTWTSFHRRGEILRDVITATDRRRDGLLPLDLDGVAETFADETDLLGALQLRWHTRLAGRLERELMHQPLDLEAAVVAAWHATADQLPGVRAVLDRETAEPRSAEIARALAVANAKEHVLLAVSAGRVSASDARAARVGAEIERRARTTHRPAPVPVERPQGLLSRLRAVVAA